MLAREVVGRPLRVYSVGDRPDHPDLVQSARLADMLGWPRHAACIRLLTSSSTPGDPMSSMRRLTTIVAAITAGLLAAPAWAEDTKVAIAISGWTGFAPLTLANEAGLFKKNGLDVTIKMGAGVTASVKVWVVRQ